MSMSPSGFHRSTVPRLAVVAVLCLLAPGCTTEAPARSVHAPIGEPLPGLNAEQLARFEAGRALFRHPFSPEEGLGPRFNENACNACHTDPVDGGTGETGVTRATRERPPGTCDALDGLGGANLRLNLIPALRGNGPVRVPVPAEATHSARFTVPFIFGLGLVEAVPQDALDRLATRSGGLVGRDALGRPARFGRKADVATLEAFVDSAFRFEMGLTTPAWPDERHAGASPPVPGYTPSGTHPEIDAETLARVTDFMRFLAPPSPQEPRDAADRAVVEEGRALFGTLGCAGCHVPTLTTGPHAVEALSRKTIALYSDLLLHDMGPDLENVCAAGAGPRHLRTEPLMGLRYRRIFLHDGRVGRVRDAILAHGGEAEGARARFEALGRLEQEVLLRFLDTL